MDNFTASVIAYGSVAAAIGFFLFADHEMNGNLLPVLSVIGIVTQPQRGHLC
jgi:hypothetical protein